METQKLFIDDGLIGIEINDNGVLKFNPSDFNFYDRLMKFSKELPEIEKKYERDVEVRTEGAAEFVERQLEIARQIDAEVKLRLAYVFGYGNDFDKLFGGSNVLSPAKNGERIITNFLNAIIPFVEDGMKRFSANEVEIAKRNREQRRAAQKGMSPL